MIRGAPDTDNLIVAVRVSSLRNSVGAVWAASPIEASLVIGAAVLLAGYQAASTYNTLARCAPCHDALRAEPARWLATSLLASLVTGQAAGRSGRAAIAATAGASWLAALPWSGAARQRAVHRAGAIFGLAMSGIAAALAFALANALRADRPGLVALGAAVAFAAGLAAGLRVGRRLPAMPGITERPGTSPGAPGRRARSWSLLDAMDRAAPAHAGRWAWSGRIRLIGASWVVSLVPLGAAAASVSLIQHQPETALWVAVAGGNLVFIVALRCRPMASAVFRAAPLGFARAAGAMMRAPLAISLGWFAAVIAIPLAAGGGAWRMLPGVAACLLLLNAIYAAAALSRPEAPRQAMLLYGAGAYAVATGTITGGMPYGLAVLAAVCAVALLLGRRARTVYRAGHG